MISLVWSISPSLSVQNVISRCLSSVLSFLLCAREWLLYTECSSGNGKFSWYVLLSRLPFFVLIFHPEEKISRFFSLSYCLAFSVFQESYCFLFTSESIEIHMMFILDGSDLHKSYITSYMFLYNGFITLKFACFTKVFSVNHSACACLDGSSMGPHHTTS